MITLRSDNRTLVLNSKNSYLVDNYASGVGTVSVTNTEGIETGVFILIGEIGNESSEMFRCGTVTTATGAVQLLDAGGSPTTTLHAHGESTKVYVLPYNQVRFYWTAALGTIADENPTFDTVNPLGGDWSDIDPSSWYTTYEDSTHSSGFGWFVYRNTVSLVTSQESNPIPYAGFSYNTVAAIFEDFDTLLNVNELKLVSIADKFAWLNEALALVKNKLNLTNTEYLVTPTKSLNVVAGTSEYLLDSDFGDLVSLVDASNLPIGKIDIGDVTSYSGTTTLYYLRGRYIGFVPVPTANVTYLYNYRSKAVTVDSLSTYIDLPDNSFYALKDWMMYRACLKFQNPLAETYYTSFTNSVNLSIQSAVKRDADLDAWGIADHANA
jgi:hypothetical protein